MKIMRPKMVYYACTKYCINFQHISGFQRNQCLLVKDLRSRELNKQSIPLQFSPRRKEKKKGMGLEVRHFFLMMEIRFLTCNGS